MKLMPLKYELLGLAVLYVVWTICKAVKGWIARRKEFDIVLDNLREGVTVTDIYDPLSTNCFRMCSRTTAWWPCPA